jgi:hypothetical protein
MNFAKDGNGRTADGSTDTTVDAKLRQRQPAQSVSFSATPERETRTPLVTK